MSAVIKAVEKRSAADKAGIKPGETLIAINGKRIRDVLDYDFYSYDSLLKIDLEKNGCARTVKIKKPEGVDLGLEFETYLMDKHRRCKNSCIFCNVKSIPCLFCHKIFKFLILI